MGLSELSIIKNVLADLNLKYRVLFIGLSSLVLHLKSVSWHKVKRPERPSRYLSDCLELRVAGEHSERIGYSRP